jgi:hypothetical protein
MRQKTPRMVVTTIGAVTLKWAARKNQKAAITAQITMRAILNIPISISVYAGQVDANMSVAPTYGAADALVDSRWMLGEARCISQAPNIPLRPGRGMP